MSGKISAQPAPDLKREENTPVRDNSPFVRRSRISVVPRPPAPLLDRLDGPEVLRMSYPELNDACKHLVKKDGRLTDETDKAHVAQKLFISISFNDTTRVSLFRGTTTVTRLLNAEVENIRRIHQECLADGPMGGWVPR